MTLRLPGAERAALQSRAIAEGISAQEAARRAVGEYVARAEHRDRVAGSAKRVLTAHAEALGRLRR